MQNLSRNTNTEEQLVRQIDHKNKKQMPKIIILIAVMVLFGFGSGFLITKGTATQITSQSDIKDSKDVVEGTTLGSNDTKTFKDTAEGLLKVGGIEGEGQYHLERDGGESQYVYLTSSSVDLSLVEGKKIKVWGQTQAAQHAGWLMDVGRVEVIK